MNCARYARASSYVNAGAIQFTPPELPRRANASARNRTPGNSRTSPPVGHVADRAAQYRSPQRALWRGGLLLPPEHIPGRESYRHPSQAVDAAPVSPAPGAGRASNARLAPGVLCADAGVSLGG